MAITITKLKMWKDPGYTRGCLEVPPAGSQKLPATADYSLPASETLRPHKGSTLTAMQLPLNYLSVLGMSYLYIEAGDGVNTVKLYGWIDSITELATSSETVQINWSVDWWRSYSGSATFGSALVTRCADGSYKRPRTLQPRYKKKASETALFPTDVSTALSQNKGQLWTIVLATITITDNQSNTTSRLGYFFWPAIYPVLGNPIMKTSDNSIVNTLRAESCYNGLIDEFMFALMKKWTTNDANNSYNYQLIAAYASPIPPVAINWDDTNKYWYSGTAESDHTNITIGGTTWDMGTFFNYSGSLDMNNTYTKTFTTFTPDDGSYYSVVDFDGNPIGNLPWGIDITGAIVEVNVGPVGGYLNIRFTSSILGNSDTMAGSLSGLMFSVPLPAYPVTSNYWSDYVLSGQREFNRLNREYAREEEAWKAGISETKSALDTAVSLNPNDWLDAAVGAATGFSAIGANLMVNEEFADKYNRLDDMAASRQKNTIQENGFSFNWFYHGVANTGTRSKTTGPWLVKMEMDTVSAAEYSNEITTMGYEVQIPVTTLTSFITAAGPLKAHNAIVTGSIPPEAKQAIRTLLENGIRIIENNPSGVTP